MIVREICTEIDFLPEAIVLHMGENIIHFLFFSFCLFVSVQVYGKNKIGKEHTLIALAKVTK